MANMSSSSTGGIDNPAFNNIPLQISKKVKKEKSLMALQVQRSGTVDSAVETTTTPAVPVAENGPTVKSGRAQWSNSAEFLLSAIAMSVGLGNFYRFPYVAYKNGGGAFLIPYILVLFFIGKPLYFLELSIGQFCSYGQVQCWNMSPVLKGVGFGAALCSFCVVTYYSAIMALTVFYFFASMRSTLPWTVCDPDWAGLDACDNPNDTVSSNASKVNLPRSYFENAVLKQKDNIDDGIGFPDLRLSLCLCLSWMAVFLTLVKGVKSSGKVAYFAAIYPYVVLLILFITGCTREGAIDGILFFLTPKWHKLYDPNVWYAAVSQCFFSIGTGFGPIIMYASYNPFRHNVHRDAMIISLVDTFTSFFAGLTVFSILGTLAFQLDKPISQVVDSGSGLVFISYAEGISKFAFAPQLFSCMFFLMLFTLGVGSAVPWQMVVTTTISDQFPKLDKMYISVFACSLGFLMGLVYVTPGGQFILTLVDYFGGSFTVYVIGTIQCIGIAYFYGLRNITRDIEFMLSMKLHSFWKFSWAYTVPVVLSAILVYSLATAEPLTHNGVNLPTAAIACGWILSAACLLFIPAGSIYAMYNANGNGFVEKLRASIKPAPKWGPLLQEDRDHWEIYKANHPLQ